MICFAYNVSIYHFTANWEISVEENYSVNNHEEDIELPHFDIALIATATNNFSFSNLIGEGGFGLVYKVTESNILC